MAWYTLSLVFILQTIVHTQGSKVGFISSPQDILSGLTPSLTLNCSLSDSAASASIIGRRDLTASQHDVTSSATATRRDVTQTTDNIAMLTSLVLMKEGKDLASINPTSPAHVMDGSTNVQVSGDLTGHSVRTGYLTVTITDPRDDQLGEFTCEANAISASGHSVVLSSSLEVGSTEPSLSDLVTFVRENTKNSETLQQKNVNLEEKLNQMTSLTQDLTSKNLELSSKVSAIEKSNADLNKRLSVLQNKSDTMIFFNARMTQNLHYAKGQVLVFDYVRDNQGGDYNGGSGVFTCSVAGYYHFSLACMSAFDQQMGLKLLHNGSEVFYVHGDPGHGYKAAGNTATLLLAAGDRVKILAHYDSTLDGAYCSFSGYLVRATV